MQSFSNRHPESTQKARRTRFKKGFYSFVLSVFLCLSFITKSGCEPPPTLEEVWTLHDSIHTQLIEQLKQPWHRGDGFIYAVDVGHLLIYATMRKDKQLYARLRTFAVEDLLQNNSDDEYTKGFILWRYKQGVTPDASGTTEALRVAEGLWQGYKVFGDQDDRDLALLILRGYARHAFVDQGIWLIRNYFNLQTRSFVTNSYLVDYDPDFLARVAEETHDKQLLDTAKRSLELVKKAVTPAGLLYSTIQPEVSTLLPKDLAFFSPNDTIKLFNASTVAERAAETAPALSRKVLAFALHRSDDLHQFYFGRSGERVHEAAVGAITYASLIRLAIKHNVRSAVETFLPEFMLHAKTFKDSFYTPTIYTAGELLLTFQALREYYKKPS